MHWTNFASFTSLPSPSRSTQLTGLLARPECRHRLTHLWHLFAALALTCATSSGRAHAQGASPTSPSGAPAAQSLAQNQPATTQREETESPPGVSPHYSEQTPPPKGGIQAGYVEAFYQWNFNNPSNGITNARGFDNRHDSFTLSNVALDASWDDGGVIGRLALQVGHTPSTYYMSEPRVASASGASATDAELWKYVQQAYAGYRFGVGLGLTLTAGLFLSPIGPEALAVHENWNWSRANLFFGLPFYHTGVRVTHALTNEWSVTVAGYNGWNSVVDNNDEKSISAQVAFERSDVSAALLYFGGVERPKGAPEGRAWRHLFDSHVTWHTTAWLSVRAHANGGFEPNTYGVSAWAAGALYARVRLLPQLFVASRGDVFFEHAANNGLGRAAPIFWSAPWVTSATATVDCRPHERVSFQLEYRHDHAGAALYFGGTVEGDGEETPFVANRSQQNTVTIGTTAWF